MIAIIDTSGANTLSIQNALERLGKKSVVTSDLNCLEQATHLILPGVGHAKFAMEQIVKCRLQEFIRTTQKPLLGICLGMQLLYTELAEGSTQGLGVLPGKVLKLHSNNDYRVPNIGWSTLRLNKLFQQKSILLDGLNESASFYFVHSYYVPHSHFISAMSSHIEDIPAVLEYKNYFATQFHPEKSSRCGAQVLKNFLNIQNSQRCLE
jgi:imidazole glycerol-phosphate synthase subunit HisH